MFKGANRIYVFFAAIYLVFFLTIGYLLFFTPGMEFEQSGSGSEMKLFLKNTGIHGIRDINISTNANVIFMQISQLLPGEIREIKLSSAPNATAIYASAEYHATISKELSNSTEGGSLRYELSYPEFLQKGTTFTFYLKLCNDGANTSVSVEEKHDAKFFSEKHEIENADIPSGQCSTVPFKFTPVQSGKTEIFFNIKSFNFNQIISKEFEITD